MTKFRKKGQHTQVKFDPHEVVQWRAFLLILAAEATQAIETTAAKFAAGALPASAESVQYWRNALKVLTWIDTRIDKGIRADVLDMALRSILGVESPEQLTKG